ncbi:MAG: type IX secretion system membrane protein PorP/SprF [Paludibacteraceae bacterium]|nr:type IX secretion system membrane protein PorP/SprF [Paludibacteraceae bacterium]
MKVFWSRIGWILAFALTAVSSAFAQEEIVCDQYHFNYYLVNPAVAGAERCTHLMLTGKFQWTGIDDHPMTQTLSARTRILNNVGIGAYFYNDKNGYSYRQGGEVTFAYHIPLTQNDRYVMKQRSIQRQLSFGLSMMVNHFNFDNYLVDTYGTLDNVLGNEGMDKGIYFNANAGLYFLWDNFFLGYSMSNLIPTEYTEMGLDEPIRPLSGYGFLGYDFDFVNNMTLEPAAMFKFDVNGDRQLDINLKFMQTIPSNEDFSYWLQASYRHTLDDSDYSPAPLAFYAMGGIRFKGFHVGYAYQVGLTSFNRQNGGSHEVMLGYTWCVTKHFCR